MPNRPNGLDSVTFELVKNGLMAVADEMGIVLRRSSFSSNIKERKDFSCALFDPKGQLVAQAEHIPVHLGAMPYSVKTILQEFKNDVSEGDSFILNDPYHGGTHLPDITVAQPIFYKHVLVGFAANRAHHSDVGGSTPGSMSPLSTDITQEGIRIPPTKLTENWKPNKPILDLILSNVRTPNERLGDLRAQQASNNIAASRIAQIFDKFGRRTVPAAMEYLLEYSSRMMSRAVGRIPEGSVTAVDYLDDDGYESYDIPIRVKVTVSNGRMVFDFTGSSPQVKGAVNAVYTITLSAVYYVFRCITDPSIPANEGAFRPVVVVAPKGTVVNALPPASVAGGNVETSTRVVDVTLRALSKIVPDRVCAACQGTMNNITIGGLDPRTGRYFTYYETIAGGHGARANKNGIDGIHSHLTNTMNTPVEALESSYPFRVTSYELVQDSGGLGKYRGGMGVRRSIQVLAEDMTVTLFGERQRHRPYGLMGGGEGQPGKYTMIHPAKGTEQLKSKSVVRVAKGTIIVIATPGGGGYGRTSRICA